jgi:hypothetical protein
MSTLTALSALEQPTPKLPTFQEVETPIIAKATRSVTSDESGFQPTRTAAESVALMGSAEALTSDFPTVRLCGSWRS